MEQTLKVAQTTAKQQRARGINASLVSAAFLGLAPIFGKQSINAGLSPLGVVAFRTLFATVLLFLVMALFQRKYLYIYPAGMIGCLLAGWINGLGSLFYYSALGRIDAGVGQLLYSLYPFFVAFWMFLDNHQLSRLTAIRLMIAIPAVILLIQSGSNGVDAVGVIMMLIAAGLYALHLPINQRVLYDLPAPTVTLYTLVAMSAIVVPTYLFSGSIVTEMPTSPNIWWPVLGLTLVTFFSRLTLFTGVKHLGGLQTSLLGLSELYITIVLSQTWLGEKLTVLQWIGVALLSITLLMVGWEKSPPPTNTKGGWSNWFSSPGSSGQDLPWTPGS